MLRTRFRDFARLCTLCALISFSVAAQQAEMLFHVPAQPVAKALVDLALQARLSIGYAGVDFHEAISNPVEGRFQPDDALKRLLEGTGYEPVLVNADTILIRKVAVASVEEPRLQGSESLPAIEEIVVTTTKRAEVAQFLPYSIVVIPGAQLNDMGVQSPNDLQMHVAALSATNMGPGQDKLSIRGLSDSSISGRSQSMVGLYLDESRLTDDAADPNLRLVDINRIEIVRGAQGTLYGAGALGGLIRVITNKPVLDSEHGMVAATTSATEHGAVSGSLDTMLNIPIVQNVLGLRVVGYVKEDGGYIDDVRLYLHNINKTDTDGSRLSLLWQPDDDWTVTAMLAGQIIDAADSQYAQAGLGSLNRANFEREPYRDQFLQSSLTVEGDLDWANLTSSTAFTDRRIADQMDATQAWLSLTGYPAGPSTFDTVRRIQSVTQETRLTSSRDDELSWVGGIFISHRYESYHSLLEGPDNRGALFSARTQTRNDNADEVALFGEATYKLTPWLSLTAGARLYYSALNAEAVVGQPATKSEVFAQGKNKATGFIPKIIISAQAADNLTFYADASEGFRLGGININSPSGAINVNRRGRAFSVNATTFDSDRLWTYEVGAKTRFFGHRLVINTSAYYTSWDNIQSDQILRDGSLYTTNAGGVHVPGVEADLDIRITPRLHIESNFFWNEPKILHPNPLLIQTVGQLPGVPNSSFGLSGQYDMPVKEGWDAFARVEYSYTGPSTLGFDVHNSPSMGDYSLANLRLGLSHGLWQGSLFINNLLNEQANTFAFGNPFSLASSPQITPLRPRTIGLGLSASY